MLNLISDIIFLGANLACPKASNIFPLELTEFGDIYLVFHVTLLFLRELATGIDLQSNTTKSLLRYTLMSKS